MARTVTRSEDLSLKEGVRGPWVHLTDRGLGLLPPRPTRTGRAPHTLGSSRRGPLRTSGYARNGSSLAPEALEERRSQKDR